MNPIISFIGVLDAEALHVLSALLSHTTIVAGADVSLSRDGEDWLFLWDAQTPESVRALLGSVLENALQSSGT